MLGVTSSVSMLFLTPIASRLSGTGFEVHLVSAPPEPSSILLGEGVAWHGLPMEREPSLVLDVVSLFGWFRLIRRLSPTLVSIGTPKAAFLGLFAARLLKVPNRVYVLRGLRSETASGFVKIIAVFAERISAKCATEILAVSHSLRSKYLSSAFCAPSKIRVLGNGSSHGVCVDRFRELSASDREVRKWELGIAQGVPVLGYVGRFSTDKGFQTLVAVRELLSNSGFDHEFLLLGSLEDSARELHELNLYGRQVKNFGYVSDPENYYPVMNLLLLPTKREGFPNVVLEAACCAIPTIATNTTGTVDAVVHGETGLLVDSTEPFVFAETVREALRGPIKVANLGRRARLRARAEFEEQTVAKMQSDWYAGLVESQPRYR